MLVPTIGIEVHVELKTNSKIYSKSKNSYSNEPNTFVDVIDLGYPGTLPKLNKEVITSALKASLSLNMNINKYMTFDRKNYFYPDLPKGYQITQQQTPIGYDGYLMIDDHKVIIERLHIEEDTCKSIHSIKGTLLNYNRAGVPLIEIVTAPVIKSPEEAVKYLETLRETLLYLGISDVKIEEGSMRCDANISMKDINSDTFGTKVEVKNIGSITGVLNALEYEIKRQTDIINAGDKVIEETRRYDDKNNITISMRKKETGNDYRYHPEPDIPPVVLTQDWINEAMMHIGVRPTELREYYSSEEISDNVLKTIMNNKDIALYLYRVKDKIDVKVGANILSGDVISYLNKNKLEFKDLKISENNFIDLIKMIQENKISINNIKDHLKEILEDNESVIKIVQNKGIKQITDNDELLIIVNEVIDNNEASIIDYKNGLDRAVKYLMGQIMKITKGQANPQIVNKMLIEELSKR